MSYAAMMDRYLRACEAIGLSPSTRPVEYIRVNGEVRLYAKRDAVVRVARLLRERNGA